MPDMIPPSWRKPAFARAVRGPTPAAPNGTPFGGAARDGHAAATQRGGISDILYAAVLESRARWREMVQFAADLAFETDRQGNFVYLWPSTVLGWPAASLLGTPAARLLARPGEDPNPFETDTPIRQARVRLQGRDGHIVTLNFASGPVSADPEILNLTHTSLPLERHDEAANASPPRPGDSYRGVRGFAMAVPAPMAAPVTAAPAASHGAARLATIFWRMRAQLLPGGMIQAALHELVRTMPAEGAALLHVPATGDANASQPGLFEQFESSATPRAAIRHCIGTPPAGLVEDLQSRLTELAARHGTPWQHRTELSGRQLLLCGAPSGLGTLCAVAVWRRRSPGTMVLTPLVWSDEDVALVSAVTAVVCSALEQDQLAQEISRQTRGDALTGLLRRDAFAEEVERRFDRLDRAALPGTLLLADLTQFRAVNDAYGPERGDGLLRQTASLLRDAVRATDIVGRYGGDVFALWLDGADRFAAAERAEHICVSSAPAEKALTGDVASLLPMLPEMAIGMALRAPRTFETFDSLTLRAKFALTEAKRKGEQNCPPAPTRSAWVMSTDEPIP